jgi:hypothetical protein
MNLRTAGTAWRKDSSSPLLALRSDALYNIERFHGDYSIQFESGCDFDNIYESVSHGCALTTVDLMLLLLLPLTFAIVGASFGVFLRPNGHASYYGWIHSKKCFGNLP